MIHDLDLEQTDERPSSCRYSTSLEQWHYYIYIYLIFKSSRLARITALFSATSHFVISTVFCLTACSSSLSITKYYLHVFDGPCLHSKQVPYIRLIQVQHQTWEPGLSPTAASACMAVRLSYPRFISFRMLPIMFAALGRG